MTVSVFMITYNQEKYIDQAIQSVLTQKTSFDFEIVIGEDMSTDRTREIVLDYEKKYPGKIRVIRSDHNVGAQANAIRTLRACTNKYVALLEGDDYWTDPNKLQRQVEFLEANTDFAICFHGSYEVNSGGEEISKFNLNKDQKEITSLEDLSKANYIYTATSVFRNVLIDKIPGWFHELNAADYPLHLMVAQYGKLKFLNEKMSAYRIHEGGIFTNKKAEHLAKENIKLLQKLIKYFKGNTVVRKNLRAQLINQIQILLDIFYRNGAFQSYLKYLVGFVMNSDLRTDGNSIVSNCKNLIHLMINKVRRPSFNN